DGAQLDLEVGLGQALLERTGVWDRPGLARVRAALGGEHQEPGVSAPGLGEGELEGGFAGGAGDVGQQDGGHGISLGGGRGGGGGGVGGPGGGAGGGRAGGGAGGAGGGGGGGRRGGGGGGRRGGGGGGRAAGGWTWRLRGGGAGGGGGLGGRGAGGPGP